MDEEADRLSPNLRFVCTDTVVVIVVFVETKWSRMPRMGVDIYASAIWASTAAATSLNVWHSDSSWEYSQFEVLCVCVWRLAIQYQCWSLIIIKIKVQSTVEFILCQENCLQSTKWHIINLNKWRLQWHSKDARVCKHGDRLASIMLMTDVLPSHRSSQLQSDCNCWVSERENWNCCRKCRLLL